MAGGMETEAKPAERDAAERIPELRSVFLDFSKKMKSPPFIVPEEKVYDKQSTIDALNDSFNLFNKNVDETDLTELIEGVSVRPDNKIRNSLFYFISYTTAFTTNEKNLCSSIAN